ncbi:hypothetical protein AAC387_Pa09g0617 [Persea americana]
MVVTGIDDNYWEAWRPTLYRKKGFWRKKGKMLESHVRAGSLANCNVGRKMTARSSAYMPARARSLSVCQSPRQNVCSLERADSLSIAPSGALERSHACSSAPPLGPRPFLGSRKGDF